MKTTANKLPRVDLSVQETVQLIRIVAKSAKRSLREIGEAFCQFRPKSDETARAIFVAAGCLTPRPKPGSGLPPALKLAGAARRLRYKKKQVTDLIEEGLLHAIDIASPGASRRSYRIPVESLTRYQAARSTMPEMKPALSASASSRLRHRGKE